METLTMSAGERRRLEMLSRVQRKELTLAAASRVLGLSYRQAKRIWARYQADGDRGLVHRLRGRPSNRRQDQRKAKALALCAARYADFGPTLAAEQLAAEHGLGVAVETLRQWRIGAGQWQRRRRRKAHRLRRPRRDHRGELVQMDGSHHDWFEGRRPWAVLMVMIDDATGRVDARFAETETTVAAMELFAQYVRRRGLPQALYVDRDSIYRTDREVTQAEALAGQEPRTQFGRAMAELEVDILLAGSPQAKGRVERCHGTLQDRLVKALRLQGINDLAAANRFLERTFLPEFNRRFTVPPAQAADLHRRLPPGTALERILALHHERQVQNDGTVRWENRWLQVAARHRSLGLAGRRVTVCQQLDGRLLLLYAGRALSWKELPGPPTKALPARSPPRRSQAATKPGYAPAPKHPWRRGWTAATRCPRPKTPTAVAG